MKKTQKLSVVICCYNSKSRIKETLLHLFNQTLNEGQSFEIIIVDNNSTDDTDIFIHEICDKFNENKVELSIVYEKNPGLNNARICGVNSSTTQLILFCDDDNWLNKEYISKVLNHFDSIETLGCLGGNGQAVFENEKPFWFEQHKFGYAAFSISEDLIDLTNLPQTVYGAGMAIRKNLFLTIVKDYILLTTDRKGSKLSSGGDTEICLYVKLTGNKVIFDPNLQFYHYIPSARTKWSYCRKLYRSFGNSNAALQPYYYLLSKEDMPFIKWYLRFWWFHFSKVFSSYKRLYFFLFKDIPGEEYITIYETSFRIVFSSFLNVYKLHKHQLFLKSKFEKK